MAGTPAVFRKDRFLVIDTGGTLEVETGGIVQVDNEPAFLVVGDEVTFAEDGDTTYTGTIAIPAGATILNIELRNTVLWDDGTAASMVVGDAADADGWFTAVDLKATDILATEVIDFNNTGGTEGAYIVTATGVRNKTYNAAATSVIGVITTTDQDGTAGRTRMLVTYVTPAATAALGTN